MNEYTNMLKRNRESWSEDEEKTFFRLNKPLYDILSMLEGNKEEINDSLVPQIFSIDT